jgi:uncharacterized protein (DUF111 family)
MLLGALDDLGALGGLPALLDSLADLGVDVSTAEVVRAGLRAHSVTVSAAASQPHRRLPDIHAVIERAALPAEARRRAAAVFERLAAAEARCHGTGVEGVEFHEVGAVDSIVDVLGACLGLHSLSLDALVVGEIALGGGTARSGHGEVPVPTPAALELLKGTRLAPVARSSWRPLPGWPSSRSGRPRAGRCRRCTWRTSGSAPGAGTSPNARTWSGWWSATQPPHRLPTATPSRAG